MPLEMLENQVLFPYTTEVVDFAVTLRWFGLDAYSVKIKLLNTAIVQSVLATT